jgi:hypothetical protein
MDLGESAATSPAGLKDLIQNALTVVTGYRAVR